MYEISHDNIIQRRDILEYLDYLHDLERDSNDEENYTPDERAEMKAELDEHDPVLVEQLRDMVMYGEDDFISENYWKEYASDMFDDCFLTGESVALRGYIDYDAFADDLKQDYSALEYDGTTYYTRE